MGEALSVSADTRGATLWDRLGRGDTGERALGLSGTRRRLGKGGPLGTSLPEACPRSGEKDPCEGSCWEFELEST